MVATIGAAVLTSMVAASRVMPGRADAETDQGDRDRQPGADDGAEREHQDQQRGDDADQLAVALHRGGGGAGQLAAELDLEAGVAGRRRRRPRAARGCSYRSGSVTGTSYCTVEQRGVAVLGDPRRRRPRRRGPCPRAGRSARSSVGGGRARAPSSVVHDDLGAGVAGAGDVLAELVDAALGGCAGDVPVVAGVPPNAPARPNRCRRRGPRRRACARGAARRRGRAGGGSET